MSDDHGRQRQQVAGPSLLCQQADILYTPIQYLPAGFQVIKNANPDPIEDCDLPPSWQAQNHRY